MKNTDRQGRDTPLERAQRDPLGLQRDWLTATEEGTGQATLEEAIDVATGGEPEPPLPSTDPEADHTGRPIIERFG